MTSIAKTPDEYLAQLPDDRRAALTAVRKTIRDNLPKGYAEGMQYGGIGYFVPHSIYPAGYHCDPKQPLPFVMLGAQKSHMSVHLLCVYMNPELKHWFEAEYKKTGKKLDMGAACVRFKKLDDLPVDLIGRTVARIPVAAFIATYENLLPPSVKKKRAAAAAKTGAKADKPGKTAKTTNNGKAEKAAAPAKKASAAKKVTAVKKVIAGKKAATSSQSSRRPSSRTK